MKRTAKNLTAVIAVLLIIGICFSGCKGNSGSVKKSLENAVKQENFKNVQATITYSYEMIPQTDDEKRQVENEDHSNLDAGKVIKYGELYYQEGDNKSLYYATEDETDYVYYRNTDENVGDKTYARYFAEDLAENTQFAKKMNFDYFSSITKDMFEDFDEKTYSCYATDKYKKAIIQTLFPNNSFDKLTDISLQFIIDNDKISEIVYKYTFDKSTKFVMNYKLEYNNKKVELPKKYQDLTQQ